MNVPPQLNLNSDIQLRLFPVAPLAQNPLLAVVVCPEHHCLTRNGDADFKMIGL